MSWFQRIGRLPMQVGAAFALAMIAMGIITFAVADQWEAGRIDSLLRYHQSKYLLAVTEHNASDDWIARRIRNWEARKVMSERTYILFDRQGRRIAGRLDISPPPEGISDVQFYGGGRHIQKGRALAARLPSGSLLVIVQHRAASAGLNALLPIVVVIISLCSLAMGITATILFADMTAKRLYETQSAADAIAAGDLSRRVPTERLDGMFAVQADSLNRMLDRMEAMVQSQRLFSSNLAHDLRTPLTRLKTMLAECAVGDPSQAARSLERAEHECIAIINIFDALLRLAEIETGRHPTAMAQLNLRPLLEDVAETMEPVIADHGGLLEVHRLDEVAIVGDPDLINQLLINLLENIATHTPNGTNASLTLEHVSNDALIIIRDNGPGLAANDRDRVTKPFERGSLISNKRGSGLGLAIAQAIVQFHRGHLELVDAAPGLEVRIRIPANDPAIADAPDDFAAA